MIREGLICGVAVIASIAFVGERPSGGGYALLDDFDGGIGRGWAVRQEENGRLDIVAAPGRAGRALRAAAGPKRGRVSKAALIARPAPMRAGTRVTVAFDVRVPAKTPRDSMQLVDLECATCGEGGNPGIRLYLRRGRLRIDRSKIGVRHAWVDDSAPVLGHDRWHRIEMDVRLGDAASGSATVRLDGKLVLTGRGATLLPSSDHADRIQIGITANSNPQRVQALFDRVAIRAH